MNVYLTMLIDKYEKNIADYRESTMVEDAKIITDLICYKYAGKETVDILTNVLTHLNERYNFLPKNISIKE